MSQREELYQALRNADAAGDAAGAKKLAEYIQSLPAEPAAASAEQPGMLATLGGAAGKGFGDVVLGAQGLIGKGLSAVGAKTPGEWLQKDAATGKANMAAELAPYKAANPITSAIGETAGQIVATAPVGAALGAGVKAAGANRLGSAIATSGMTTGAAPAATAGGRLADLAIRSAGGAVTGGASAGLVNTDDALTGAAIGGALPGALQLAGAAGKAVGSAVRGGAASPDVAALATRAKQLGIDIPADRLVDSKPMNAVASALNYVPFSGRAATEAKMGEQLNTAASKLIGQSTPNMTKALRDASVDLGAKFDRTLQSTGVAFDQTLLGDVSRVFNTAERELGSDALKPIASQVDEIVAKGASGVIDGQAAYNIKRTLDRIGRGNTPAAFHALELKGVLMDALNRSLGPTEAAAFAQTRQQYGNMLALEKLAKNGVDGELSVARLANLRNINNQPLQELADIAAQFVKAREGQHGAMQRAVVGLGTASAAGPVGLAAGAAGGRAANMALNSNLARELALGRSPNALQILANPSLSQFGYRSAPLIGADQ